MIASAASQGRTVEAEIASTSPRAVASAARSVLDHRDSAASSWSGPREVADRFGVTQSAVAKVIDRGRINIGEKNLRALPRKVLPEHRNLAVPRMLRIGNRISHGQDVGPSLAAQGEGFLRRLREDHLVIHFEPDIEPYFFRVPARPGIDTGLVRELDLPEVSKKPARGQHGLDVFPFQFTEPG